MFRTAGIIALAAMLPGGAWAESLAPMDHADDEANYKACMAEAGHDPEDCRWHLKFDNCLMTDNRGPNHDGEEFCIKDGKGMSQDQIDAWYLQDAKKTLAERDARHKEAEARNEKIAAAQKEIAANEACLTNGDWKTCGDNNGVIKVAGQYGEVAVTCQEAANTQAKYGTPKWPWLPFQNHEGGKSALTDGTMRFFENSAQFQNMFGAMAHVIVACDYNFNTKTATVQVEQQ
jgi:hypothetical protein